MRLLYALPVLALAAQLGAQPAQQLPDEIAIRNIVDDENATWKKATRLGTLVTSRRRARSDIAIVETLTAVIGIDPNVPGITRDDKGRLRTRLLQVLAKDNGAWKIVSYHNVDVKAGIPLPEPR